MACTITSLIHLWCLCVLLQNGWTVLHYACLHGHPRCVEVLLDCQAADPRIVDTVCTIVLRGVVRGWGGGGGRVAGCIFPKSNKSYT